MRFPYYAGALGIIRILNVFLLASLTSETAVEGCWQHLRAASEHLSLRLYFKLGAK
jgi:hypothetical protein